MYSYLYISISLSLSHYLDISISLTPSLATHMHTHIHTVTESYTLIVIDQHTPKPGENTPKQRPSDTPAHRHTKTLKHPIPPLLVRDNPTPTYRHIDTAG